MVMSPPLVPALTLQVMAPSTPSPWRGPSAPRRRNTLPGATYTTCICSTEPPSMSVSHQQPPARPSNVRFAALPENVCSELHHRAGCSSAAYALSGAAATCTLSQIPKPFWPALITSAAAGRPIDTAAARAAPHATHLFNAIMILLPSHPHIV